MEKRQILLTNDDGIRSPGLWAAAEALSRVGYVTVVAPREQASSTGRSLPHSSDGIIRPEKVMVAGKEWTVYAVGGTPAQAVLHGVLEIMPREPDLVVSGINYGENVATGITISGTVGAALEAASMGIPALAVSLETATEHHFSYSGLIQFSTAAYFSAYFAIKLLEKSFPPDVDLLKIDIPSDATEQTPWRITRVARQRYFTPVPPKRSSWEERGTIGYIENANFANESEDSDVFVLRIKREVSVAPLSIDLTSRVNFQELEHLLRKG